MTWIFRALSNLAALFPLQVFFYCFFRESVYSGEKGWSPAIQGSPPVAQLLLQPGQAMRLLLPNDPRAVCSKERSFSMKEGSMTCKRLWREWQIALSVLPLKFPAFLLQRCLLWPGQHSLSSDAVNPGTTVSPHLCLSDLFLFFKDQIQS